MRSSWFTLISKLDVLVGDNYRLTIDSDPESLVEDDCFFRETEGGFESVIHSKFCLWSLCTSI